MANSLDALLSQGAGKLNQGDIRGAETLFQQAHAAFPKEPVPLFLIGMMKLNSADFIAAETFLRRALAMAPDQPKVCIHLAHALRMQHRAAEAVPFCKITVAAQPDNVDAHLELAKSLEECNCFAEAEAAYRNVLSRCAEPRASLGLGSMLNRMDRSVDAEAVLQAALGLERQDGR